MDTVAFLDQQEAAHREVARLTGENWMLLEDHRIHELAMEARNRVPDGDQPIEARVVPATMPGYADRAAWLEPGAGDPVPEWGRRGWGHRPEHASIPKHGTCVWGFHVDPATGDLGRRIGPVKVVWVPVGMHIVQFEFCDTCAESLAHEFPKVQWREPNVTL